MKQDLKCVYKMGLSYLCDALSYANRGGRVGVTFAGGRVEGIILMLNTMDSRVKWYWSESLKGCKLCMESPEQCEFLAMREPKVEVVWNRYLKCIGEKEI